MSLILLRFWTLISICSFRLDGKGKEIIKMKGGFDVEFVELPDDNVTCSICLHVLRQPLQAIERGHRFCESCVADLKRG